MADSPEVRRYLDVLGQREIDVGHLPALLATVLAFSPKSSNVVVADIDWHTLLSGQPALKSSTRFADFAAGPGGGGLDFRAELYALPADQQLEVLTSTLVDQVAAVLGVPADAIDHHTSLSELGLDSLSSVELASRVAATLDIRISASDFERLPGVAAIAKQTLVAADVS
ncbi:acyl carrier protein [Gordonia sp. NPDC003424]